MVAKLYKLFQDISLYGLEKIGLYYSQYRGFVADNNDPQGYGRLKVSVPDIYGDDVINTWAWPTSVFAGKGYGLQCIPQINTLIWVSFERGNPRKPLWTYGYFGKGDKPDELKDVKNFWFKTPGGHLIQLNDSTGEITISSESSEVEVEPAVLGDKNQKNLEDLIEILKSAKVNTSIGPQGFLPNSLLQLDELKEALPESKSTVIKIN